MDCIDPVRGLAAEARRVHAIYSSNQQDYAQQNARQLAAMPAVA